MIFDPALDTFVPVETKKVRCRVCGRVMGALWVSDELGISGELKIAARMVGEGWPMSLATTRITFACPGRRCRNVQHLSKSRAALLFRNSATAVEL